MKNRKKLNQSVALAGAWLGVVGSAQMLSASIAISTVAVNNAGSLPLESSTRSYAPPSASFPDVGFRVSEVPEPGSIAALAFGGLVTVQL